MGKKKDTNMKRDDSNINRVKSKKMKEIKNNPFEIQTSKQKFEVVGMKPKDNSGLPGLSRHKGNIKRERTLLHEYRDRNKNSKFLDLRIGEKNLHMDPEKKIMLRMAAEKKRQFSKKSLYNLNDDEELMHGGEALTDATMKDKHAFSDDDDDEDLLDAKFVKEQHFGGDIFTRKQSDNESGKSRRDVIEEIIAESKKKKAEMKKEKEEQNDAVSKLDSGFQNFLSLMSGKLMTDEDKEKSKKNCEFKEYDIAVRKMAFDRCKRAVPANRLKTEEEIADEEREKLRVLEEERQGRMNGDLNENHGNVIVEQSADSLADGFYVKKDKRFHVSYKDGIMLDKEKEITPNLAAGNNPLAVRIAESKQVPEVSLPDNSNDSGKEESDDSSDESDQYSDILEESDSDTENKDIKKKHTGSMEELEDEMSVGEGSGSEDDEEEESSVKSKESETKSENEEKMDESNIIDVQKAIEDAKKELPYTFEVPNEYDSFWNLLQSRTPTEVSIILERMIICNNPSLGHDKKDKFNTIFAYMLQTFHCLCSVDAESFVDDVSPYAYIDSFIPHFYSITQHSPSDCAAALTQVVDEKYEEYLTKPKRYPYADTFIFLKLSGLLFPASDFHHDVMTRVKAFLTHLLYECKVTTGREILALLFTSSLLFEYISRSARFVGELSNALKGIIYLCIPSTQSKLRLPYTPPFKRVGPLADLLVIQKCHKTYEPPKFTLSGLNDEIEINDDFRIKALNESLKLLNKLCTKWIYLSSVRTIFHAVMKLTKQIPVLNYPEETSQLIEELHLSINELPPQGAPLAKEHENVKSLRMFEPVVSEVIDGVKNRGGAKAYQEKQKLIHKIRRERKGAKRELRRDTAFIARQQLTETLTSDAERKRKVNLIMQGLATQESEFKKMKEQK